MIAWNSHSQNIFWPSYWKKDVYGNFRWSNAWPLMYKMFFTNFGRWNFASLKLLLWAISLYNQHSWIVFTSTLPVKKSYHHSLLVPFSLAFVLVGFSSTEMSWCSQSPYQKPNPARIRPRESFFAVGCWNLSTSVGNSRLIVWWPVV